jgi:hypothetical protein
MHRVPDYADRRLQAALNRYLAGIGGTFESYIVTSRVNKESHTAWLVVVDEETWTVRDYFDGRVTIRRPGHQEPMELEPF